MLRTATVSFTSPGERLLLINTPIKDAPWFLEASGYLNNESMPYLNAAIQAARHGEPYCPVLDLTLVEQIDTDASEQLANLVERGEVNLLSETPPDQQLPARLAVVLRESRLEAAESILSLVRQRRNDGLADCPVIAQMLARLQRPGMPL